MAVLIGSIPARQEPKIDTRMNLGQYLAYLRLSGVLQDDVHREMLKRVRKVFRSLFPLDNPKCNGIWSKVLNKPELPDNPFVIAICPVHAELGLVQSIVLSQMRARDFPIELKEGTLKLCSDQVFSRECSSLVELQQAIEWFVDRLATDFGYSEFEITDHSSEFRSDSRLDILRLLDYTGE